MNKSKIFSCFLLAFIGGIFWKSYFEILQSFYFLSLLLISLLLVVFYRNFKATFVAFFVLFFVFGVWLTDCKLKKIKTAVFANQIFQEDVVVKKVVNGEFGQNLIIEMKSSSLNWSEENFLLLLQTPQYPTYEYGDLLNVSCVARIIENKNSSFDYRMYMAKDDILYKCEKPEVKKIGERKGNIFYAFVLNSRKFFSDKINLVISQPEAALAVGLLLGGSSDLTKNIQADFAKTGMTHMVAVSGYNVTIIAEYLILVGIFMGMWRAKAILFALVGIFLFVMLSGFPASAVRAGFMGAILLWAMKNGRLSSSGNAIILAAAIMLLFNPLLLRYDFGFQLSFLATIGIVVVAGLWENNFAKKHKAFGISEALILTLSAQIFVFPIIAYNFGTFSLVSLLANIFILPLIPLSMLLVFLVVISGIIYEPISYIFAWIVYIPLHYMLNLIHILAQFPWASISVESVPVYYVGSYYLIVICLVVKIKKININSQKIITK